MHSSIFIKYEGCNSYQIVSFVSPVSLDYHNISGIDSYLKGVTKHQYIPVCTKFGVCIIIYRNQNRNGKVSQMLVLFHWHRDHKKKYSTSIFILDFFFKLKPLNISLTYVTHFVLPFLELFLGSFENDLCLDCWLQTYDQVPYFGSSFTQKSLYNWFRLLLYNQDTDWSIEVA